MCAFLGRRVTAPLTFMAKEQHAETISAHYYTTELDKRWEQINAIGPFLR